MPTPKGAVTTTAPTNERGAPVLGIGAPRAVSRPRRVAADAHSEPSDSMH